MVMAGEGAQDSPPEKLYRLESHGQDILLLPQRTLIYEECGSQPHLLWESCLSQS